MMPAINLQRLPVRLVEVRSGVEQEDNISVPGIIIITEFKVCHNVTLNHWCHLMNFHILYI